MKKELFVDDSDKEKQTSNFVDVKNEKTDLLNDQNNQEIEFSLLSNLSTSNENSVLKQLMYYEVIENNNVEKNEIQTEDEKKLKNLIEQVDEKSKQIKADFPGDKKLISNNYMQIAEKITAEMSEIVLLNRKENHFKENNINKLELLVYENEDASKKSENISASKNKFKKISYSSKMGSSTDLKNGETAKQKLFVHMNSCPHKDEYALSTENYDKKSKQGGMSNSSNFFKNKSIVQKLTKSVDSMEILKSNNNEIKASIENYTLRKNFLCEKFLNKIIYRKLKKNNYNESITNIKTRSRLEKNNTNSKFELISQKSSKEIGVANSKITSMDNYTKIFAKKINGNVIYPDGIEQLFNCENNIKARGRKMYNKHLHLDGTEKITMIITHSNKIEQNNIIIIHPDVNYFINGKNILPDVMIQAVGMLHHASEHSFLKVTNIKNKENIQNFKILILNISKRRFLGNKNIIIINQSHQNINMGLVEIEPLLNHRKQQICIYKSGRLHNILIKQEFKIIQNTYIQNFKINYLFIIETLIEIHKSLQIYYKMQSFQINIPISSFEKQQLESLNFIQKDLLVQNIQFHQELCLFNQLHKIKIPDSNTILVIHRFQNNAQFYKTVFVKTLIEIQNSVKLNYSIIFSSLNTKLTESKKYLNFLTINPLIFCPPLRIRGGADTQDLSDSSHQISTTSASHQISTSLSTSQNQNLSSVTTNSSMKPLQLINTPINPVSTAKSCFIPEIPNYSISNAFPLDMSQVSYMNQLPNSPFVTPILHLALSVGNTYPVLQQPNTSSVHPEATIVVEETPKNGNLSMSALKDTTKPLIESFDNSSSLQKPNSVMTGSLALDKNLGDSPVIRSESLAIKDTSITQHSHVESSVPSRVNKTYPTVEKQKFDTIQHKAIPSGSMITNSNDTSTNINLSTGIDLYKQQNNAESPQQINKTSSTSGRTFAALIEYQDDVGSNSANLSSDINKMHFPKENLQLDKTLSKDMEFEFYKIADKENYISSALKTSDHSKQSAYEFSRLCSSKVKKECSPLSVGEINQSKQNLFKITGEHIHQVSKEYPYLATKDVNETEQISDKVYGFYNQHIPNDHLAFVCKDLSQPKQIETSETSKLDISEHSLLSSQDSGKIQHKSYRFDTLHSEKHLPLASRNSPEKAEFTPSKVQSSHDEKDYSSLTAKKTPKCMHHKLSRMQVPQESSSSSFSPRKYSLPQQESTKYSKIPQQIPQNTKQQIFLSQENYPAQINHNFSRIQRSDITRGCLSTIPNVLPDQDQQNTYTVHNSHDRTHHKFTNASQNNATSTGYPQNSTKNLSYLTSDKLDQNIHTSSQTSTSSQISTPRIIYTECSNPSYIISSTESNCIELSNYSNIVLKLPLCIFGLKNTTEDALSPSADMAKSETGNLEEPECRSRTSRISYNSRKLSKNVDINNVIQPPEEFADLPQSTGIYEPHTRLDKTEEMVPIYISQPDELPKILPESIIETDERCPSNEQQLDVNEQIKTKSEETITIKQIHTSGSKQVRFSEDKIMQEPDSDFSTDIAYSLDENLAIFERNMRFLFNELIDDKSNINIQKTYSKILQMLKEKEGRKILNSIHDINTFKHIIQQEISKDFAQSQKTSVDDLFISEDIEVAKDVFYPGIEEVIVTDTIVDRPSQKHEISISKEEIKDSDTIVSQIDKVSTEQIKIADSIIDKPEYKIRTSSDIEKVSDTAVSQKYQIPEEEIKVIDSVVDKVKQEKIETFQDIEKYPASSINQIQQIPSEKIIEVDKIVDKSIDKSQNFRKIKSYSDTAISQINHVSEMKKKIEDITTDKQRKQEIQMLDFDSLSTDKIISDTNVNQVYQIPDEKITEIDIIIDKQIKHPDIDMSEIKDELKFRSYDKDKISYSTVSQIPAYQSKDGIKQDSKVTDTEEMHISVTESIKESIQIDSSLQQELIKKENILFPKQPEINQFEKIETKISSKHSSDSHQQLDIPSTSKTTFSSHSHDSLEPSLGLNFSHYYVRESKNPFQLRESDIVYGRYRNIDVGSFPPPSPKISQPAVNINKIQFYTRKSLNPFEDMKFKDQQDIDLGNFPKSKNAASFLSRDNDFTSEVGKEKIDLGIISKTQFTSDAVCQLKSKIDSFPVNEKKETDYRVFQKNQVTEKESIYNSSGKYKQERDRFTEEGNKLVKDSNIPIVIGTKNEITDSREIKFSSERTKDFKACIRNILIQNARNSFADENKSQLILNERELNILTIMLTQTIIMRSDTLENSEDIQTFLNSFTNVYVLVKKFLTVTLNLPNALDEDLSLEESQLKILITLFAKFITDQQDEHLEEKQFIDSFAQSSSVYQSDSVSSISKSELMSSKQNVRKLLSIARKVIQHNPKYGQIIYNKGETYKNQITKNFEKQERISDEALLPSLENERLFCRFADFLQQLFEASDRKDYLDSTDKTMTDLFMDVVRIFIKELKEKRLKISKHSVSETDISKITSVPVHDIHSESFDSHCGKSFRGYLNEQFLKSGTSDIYQRDQKLYFTKKREKLLGIEDENETLVSCKSRHLQEQPKQNKLKKEISPLNQDEMSSFIHSNISHISSELKDTVNTNDDSSMIMRYLYEQFLKSERGKNYQKNKEKYFSGELAQIEAGKKILDSINDTSLNEKPNQKMSKTECPSTSVEGQLIDKSTLKIEMPTVINPEFVDIESCPKDNHDSLVIIEHVNEQLTTSKKDESYRGYQRLHFSENKSSKISDMKNLANSDRQEDKQMIQKLSSEEGQEMNNSTLKMERSSVNDFSDIQFENHLKDSLDIQHEDSIITGHISGKIIKSKTGEISQELNQKNKRLHFSENEPSILVDEQKHLGSINFGYLNSQPIQRKIKKERPSANHYKIDNSGLEKQTLIPETDSIQFESQLKDSLDVHHDSIIAGHINDKFIKPKNTEIHQKSQRLHFSDDEPSRISNCQKFLDSFNFGQKRIIRKESSPKESKVFSENESIFAGLDSPKQQKQNFAKQDSTVNMAGKMIDSPATDVKISTFKDPEVLISETCLNDSLDIYQKNYGLQFPESDSLVYADSVSYNLQQNTIVDKNIHITKSEAIKCKTELKYPNRFTFLRSSVTEKHKLNQINQSGKVDNQKFSETERKNRAENILDNCDINDKKVIILADKSGNKDKTSLNQTDLEVPITASRCNKQYVISGSISTSNKPKMQKLSASVSFATFKHQNSKSKSMMEKNKDKTEK
ncbi:uncharacterized protein LOC111640406 [Centruroides sculpturatus]|uniref:uncharacterized protein LOC111640406 n=1 Tax=Centruroides sculpturatus TaxID=218467 RepID=UPI000C6E4FAF|nr:uncharacterized protein LOC111640406 [Centruroides sculpturatus]